MKNKFDTPILFLTYNKTDTTKKILKKILTIKPENLIISSDGGKNYNENIDILKLRNYIDNKTESLKLTKIYNNNNLGCKKSVTNAIDESFKNFKKLIILEDDTLPSFEFFLFVQRMLKLYENNNEINIVSGYNYLTKSKSSQTHYFSRYTNIWGWGTWKNQWENRIELNNDTLNKFKSSNLNEVFHSEFEKDYFLERFDDVVYNGLDTWDYGLVFSNFYQKKLSIYPKYNLVKNIGLGHKNATHTNNYYKYLISTPNIMLNKFQSRKLEYIEPFLDTKLENSFYRKIIKKNTFYNKFIYKILKVFNKI